MVTIEGSYFLNPENASIFDKKKVQINIRTHQPPSLAAHTARLLPQKPASLFQDLGNDLHLPAKHFQSTQRTARPTDTAQNEFGSLS